MDEENEIASLREILMKYTLIVAEKPTAAERIAKALDKKSKPKMRKEKGVPYFIAERDRKIVVVPALGHLYTVAQGEGKKSCYPVFSFKWAPRYLVERGAQRTKMWIETISNLGLDADVFIDACDYDIEGCLIGYSILNFACGKADVAKRMKYSTLTKTELEQAYDHLLPTLDFSLIEAGKTRHEIDWLYGINLSRALTSAVKRATGRYATLSTGRVQGPALRFLVLRENSIACFVPTPYWAIKAQVEVQGEVYEAEYEKKTIENKAEADAIVRACKKKTGEIAKIEEKTFRQNPPSPFDLGTLQSEAYRLFGYNPRRTINLAERLYLDALISYPRTSSQKLPPTINYKSILTGLRRKSTYRKLASELLALEKLKPKEGKKEDPAHPAVYPTGNLPERKLDASERKLWDLIVRRFMAAFGELAIKQNMKAEIDVNGYRFFLSGRKILREGWIRYYKLYVRSDEIWLPDIKEGEKVRINEVLCENKFTKPPPRYNPSSLLKKMEKEGIGTKATRADIIQTLYNRRYITEESIRVTELGHSVIETLQKHVPSVVSVKLTRELEKKMQRIQNNEEKRENVLAEVIDRLKPVLEDLKNQERTIGQILSEAVRQSRLQERIIGVCPACETGKLIILRSRKTGKRFIGCTNYFKSMCKTSFPLPQIGTVKPTGRTCKACEWPIVIVFRKGRRPWRLCINPACPRKEERKKHVEMQDMQQRNSK
ncbi:MAG: DNA topoisomerase I [Candidatus Bathyarchaeia archaeon]